MESLSELITKHHWGTHFVNSTPPGLAQCHRDPRLPSPPCPPAFFSTAASSATTTTASNPKLPSWPSTQSSAGEMAQRCLRRMLRR
ncbi:hypothetical protein RchiOBHm_Chr2g0089281 [Rosa chinensis]|uniref:Uncharacterized protein n=1 Tax=Rosa chinensis TaxID=74649 RepID=A0A2P6RJ45_ROSCH|nr:hypothetical protein RchiOBHm_Chr2g0089281 [Rosa chinensis]